MKGDVKFELEVKAPPAAAPPLKTTEVLSVLARAGVLFFRFSPDEGVTFLTPNAEKVLGYTPEELRGDPDIVAKVVDPEFLDHLDRAMPSFFVVRDEAIRIEVPFIAKNGDRVRLEARFVPEIGESGAVLGFYGVAVDARPQERGAKRS